MDKETKRRFSIIVMGIIGIIALLSGVSYAAFSSELAGTQIQGVKSGCLKVDMLDNGNVALTNQVPETDQNGLLTTPYTYTLTNTCTTDAYYTATLNVLDTSNLDNIAKTKVALNGDSYLAPTIESNLEEMESVDTSQTNVEKTYKLDEGYLKVGETKTFELRTWIDYDVTEISGGIENMVIVTSKASGVGTIDHNTNTPAYQVLSKSELLTNQNYKSIAPNGDQLSGIIKVGEGENAKYYFRGNPNNYITFAGKTFRILSTNPDGSINIVLNSIYKTATYANLSTNLTSFYNEISQEEKYIKTDQTFCEEKADANGNYLAKLRVENNNPTENCASASLTKIGLLTADDLMYAGATVGTANTSFYLKDTTYYTTSHKDSSNVYAYQLSNSLGTIAKTTLSGIKPVITLKNDTLLYGQGTETEPFYVSGTYSETIDKYQDDIAPTIVYARVDEKWSKENKQISISANDNPGGSGIAGYLVSQSNTTPSLTDPSWEASSSSKYLSVNGYNNGTYYVFAKDQAGNISESTKLVIEKVDKEAPTCTIRINPNGTDNEFKTLTILSEDENIDIKGYSWAHTDSTEDVVKVEQNGVYTGYLTDLAGNKGSCSGTVTSVKVPQGASAMLISKVGESGLEEIIHEADDTLQIGATEDIIEYRFRGGNDVVKNNYVYFNCTDPANQTAATCSLYRIMGVFPTDNGNGKIENRVKIIPAEDNRNTYLWNENGTNNWTEPATINTKLNTDYWNSVNGKYKVVVGDAKYYLGGYDISDIKTSEMYKYERKISGAEYYRSGYKTSWTGKAGLMYASDYGYANPDTCSENITLQDQMDPSCLDNNWLYLAYAEWLLPHVPTASNIAFNIAEYGGVYSTSEVGPNEYGYEYSNLWIARPVLYLNADVEFNDIGDGTEDNPYQIKFAEAETPGQNPAPTCSISVSTEGTTSKTLTVTSTSQNLANSPYSWTSSTTGYSTTNTKTVTENGVYTAYVKDENGNVGSCTATVASLGQEETYYTVNLTVNNGLIGGDGNGTKRVAMNTSASFTLEPSSGYTTTGVVPSCTNGQTATISGNTLTTGNITSDTTCTVTLTRLMANKIYVNDTNINSNCNDVQCMIEHLDDILNR